LKIKSERLLSIMLSVVWRVVISFSSKCKEFPSDVFDSIASPKLAITLSLIKICGFILYLEMVSAV